MDPEWLNSNQAALAAAKAELGEAPLAFAPIKIVHVVSTSSLSQTIFLHSLPKRFPCMSYNPDVFAPVIHKRLNPKATCLIFASGTVVITGVVSPWAAKMVLQQLCTQLQTVYANIHLINFRIVNMVLKTKFSAPIFLQLVKRLFPLESYHEEEVFPGLVFRDYKSSVVLTIYRTGSVILPGHRNAKTIRTAAGVLERIRDRYDAAIRLGRFDPESSSDPTGCPASGLRSTGPSLQALAQTLRQDLAETLP